MNLNRVRIKIFSSLLLLAFSLASLSPPTQADTAYVAVAANFLMPAKALKSTFESHFDHKVKLSFSSSGKHYAQIINGAPFDIFLSADKLKPLQLVERHSAVANTFGPYAIGQLILWAPSYDLSEHVEVHYRTKNALPTDEINHTLLVPKVFIDAFNDSGNPRQKIAIANARLAPYGQAAQQALAALGLLNQSSGLFVQGENITQTYQFVRSGNTQFGFIAMSQTKPSQPIDKGMWAVPSQLHEPIEQYAVLLNRGENNLAAKAFLAFLRSSQAQEIIRQFGYFTPPSSLVADGVQL